MIAGIEADIHALAPQAIIPGLPRVLSTYATIDRAEFVGRGVRRDAYRDSPLSIGHGQTISAPSVVAVMTAGLDLRPADNVLEVGTGSGFQAAVLSRLARRVSSVEIVGSLARSARVRLRRLGFANITVRTGDGFAGWPERAPFDGIIVTAGVASIPRALIDQLAIGGRLVIPIGPSTPQEQLFLITRRADGELDRCILGPAMFVPLTGRGQRPPSTRGLMDHATPFCYGAAIT